MVGVTVPAAVVFQSTHPSGVRLLAGRRSFIYALISIHAPQWGATITIAYVTPGYSYFNPRTPVGCDCNVVSRFVHNSVISIHAPQWGATIQPQFVHLPVRISIHAPQWGATDARAAHLRKRSYFNPRTPVGCDWTASSPQPNCPNFNPRTPVGCD